MPSAATLSAPAPTRGSKSSGTCSPAMVLLGAPYTLKVNEHVRVDLVYGMISERAATVDRHHRRISVPAAVLRRCMIYFTWPWFVEILEHQRDLDRTPAASIRWPVKLLLPVGFALMFAAGHIRNHQTHRRAHEHVIDDEFTVRKAAAMIVHHGTTWRP